MQPAFGCYTTVGDDFHRDLGFLHTEEELRPCLGGESDTTPLWVRRHDEYEHPA
jgi:hypothetical protein